MNPNPTESSLVVVDADDPVEEARGVLNRTRSGIALVFDRHQPVGIVTIADIERAPDEHAPISAIMNKELVTIDPRTDDLRTLRVYNNAAWQSLRRRRVARTSGG